MTAKRRESAETRRLRKVAEKALEGNPPGASSGPFPADTERLVHELRVHQVELEMQNEELRRTQYDLEAARDAAQAANRAKGAFLANMSHEIRTPLSGVIGMLRLLRETPLDDSQRRYAELAATSAAQLLHLIDDILDFSKIEAGKLEFESVEFSPRLVTEESFRGLSILAQQKGISLSCRIEPEVPKLLVGDPHRLRQVLVNLVGNAVKFTERGEVEIQVTLEGTRGSADARHCDLGGSAREPPSGLAAHSSGRPVTLCFTVRDTGIGIPTDRMDRLFQSFSQVDDSTARTFGGTGLGLAISRQLVEQMGGSIRVQSETGSGSVFAFSVPLAVARPKPRATDAALAVMRDEADTIPMRVRILVAEDEPINREVAVTYLQKRRDWQVMAVGDGRAAAEAVSFEAFDLVLMDIQMPGLDGFEATRLIREQESPGGPRIPIIGLTAHALKGDRDKCLEAGMDDYLAKPVDPETLCATVERWVGNPSRQPPPKNLPEGNALARLRSHLSSEQREELRRSFLENLNEGLANIQEALAKGDARQLAFWAHRLRGSLVVFGFAAAAGIAQGIETLTEAPRFDGVAALVTALERELERVVAALEGQPGV
ncbi:MAG: response regulator [Deltaproteobacteria bacterium]|nr:response regulator [Deltaproteobacteria bacterium]